MTEARLGFGIFALCLYAAGLALPYAFPMTPLDLLLYGLAFAGGALVFGAGLLVLFAGFLWLLGSRERP